MIPRTGHPSGLSTAAVLLGLLLAGDSHAQDRDRLLPRPGPVVVEITAVQPFGPAYRAGLEVGDRILEVEGSPARSLSELRQLLHAAGYSARLTVLDHRTRRQSSVYVYPEEGRIGIDARMVPAYPFGRYPF